jgi:pepF/M3 family oligoendopeptidase
VAGGLPRWDLSPVYDGFDGQAWLAAKRDLEKVSAAMEAMAAKGPPPAAAGGAAAAGAVPARTIADWLVEALALEEKALCLYSSMSAYAYARYATATRDATAMAELNSVEGLGLPLKRAGVLFRNALAARREEVLAAAKGPGADPRVAPFAFHLEEELFWQARQMSPELEDLAADLARSGCEAWSRLQESVSSNTGALWDPASGERKTIVELRNLAYDNDRSLRGKAYRLELEAWKSVEIPMAAALNGVKGFTLSINRRRGWEGVLDKSLAQARITRATLDALVAAMEDSLPAWRRYLKAKAGLLGLPSLAFYDLFGPVTSGATPRSWTFAEAGDLIVEKFGGFDPAMGDFAARAFQEGWIDAEPREGKVSGAFCTHFPSVKLARVLCNFDNSFADLTTVAHELGHAWHYECIKDRPLVLTDYPMTLAETASIFAETVVFDSAIAQAAESERLTLLELHLQDTCQVIVDILSRFRFEEGLFERRARGEVPPAELCALMASAQEATYGDGLDPGLLHPYMWAAKGHYYIPDLSFYNFPYAFGLLFGLALFARYREEGQAFAASYRDLLAMTGSASAVEVTAAAGFDIETKAFWKGGLDVLASQVGDFERLAAAARPARPGGAT